MPNAAARSLRSRRTGQIAFAMPDVGEPRLHVDGRARSRRSRARRACRLLLHSTGADAEDELAMLRDLRHRFVDGLILVLAADHRGARRRARARGRAGGRDRRAAEEHARRQRAARTRARAPPTPSGTCTRSAGGGSRSSTARRTRCRARRGGSATSTACALRARRATTRWSRSRTTSSSSRAARAAERLLARADARRALLRQRPARGRRARGAARCRARRARRRGGGGHGQHRALRAHLAAADDGRPRLGRARAASPPSCCSSGSSGPTREPRSRSASSRGSSSRASFGSRRVSDRRRGRPLARSPRREPQPAGRRRSPAARRCSC